MARRATDTDDSGAEERKELKFFEKYLNIIKLVATTILAVIALWSAFTAIEARYVKDTQLAATQEDMIELINLSSKEVLDNIVANRKIFIQNLKNERTRLKWEIKVLREATPPQSIPFYMTTRLENIEDEIDEMRKLIDDLQND